MPRRPKPPPVTIAALAASFRRSLLAANKSPRTIESYSDAVRLFADFLGVEGLPARAPEVRRAHVEAFITDQLARWKPATANNRYRGLAAFFGWAVEEGELAASPMAGMKPPHVPEVPVPVLSAEQLGRLLKTCEGRDLPHRRDAAMIRLLLDTGMRRAECSGLKVSDIDADGREAVVLGKGRRPRTVPFGHKTAQALDRYLRVRSTHRDAGLPHLWLGLGGPMTPSGIAQVVRDRGNAAGMPGLHPHQLRHTFAAAWMADGGGETDLMRLAGWKSRGMLSRYGAATADDRARAAHSRHGLGDRI